MAETEELDLIVGSNFLGSSVLEVQNGDVAVISLGREVSAEQRDQIEKDIKARISAKVGCRVEVLALAPYESISQVLRKA